MGRAAHLGDKKEELYSCIMINTFDQGKPI